MKIIKTLIFIFVCHSIILSAQECPADLKFDGKKIILSNKEWKERLTEEQYYILREQGTEPPFKNKFNDNKKSGIYTCAACSLPVFSSSTKYDSKTGWPSFWEPICPNNVTLKDDYKLFFIKRVEVNCARCESHLGHLFNDGPPPTGKRWCINSLALDFIPKGNQ